MLAVAGETLALDLDKIRERREKLGLTMEQAAEAADLGTDGTKDKISTRRQAWYMLESGRRKDVTLKMVGRLAMALKCRPKDLLREDK